MKTRKKGIIDSPSIIHSTRKFIDRPSILIKQKTKLIDLLSINYFQSEKFHLPVQANSPFAWTRSFLKLPIDCALLPKLGANFELKCLQASFTVDVFVPLAVFTKALWRIYAVMSWERLYLSSRPMAKTSDAIFRRLALGSLALACLPPPLVPAFPPPLPPLGPPFPPWVLDLDADQGGLSLFQEFPVEELAFHELPADQEFAAPLREPPDQVLEAP